MACSDTDEGSVFTIALVSVRLSAASTPTSPNLTRKKSSAFSIAMKPAPCTVTVVPPRTRPPVGTTPVGATA
eukprot:118010-Prymnesium_polylepis.1